MKDRILIVCADEMLGGSLAGAFEQAGYSPHRAADGKGAIECLSSRGIRTVVLDAALRGEAAEDPLESITARHPEVPVVVLTAGESEERSAVARGAYDCAGKPPDFGRLSRVVANSVKLAVLAEAAAKASGRIRELRPRIVAACKKMIELLARAEKIASGDQPVLIAGERGTGKELLARFIHDASRRAAYGLLKLDPGGLEEHHLNARLFGRDKGLFTGVDARSAGLFVQADGGTLLIEEIGSMPLSAQARVLRALKGSEVRRIGGGETVWVDTRVIASTSRRIPELVAKGLFREDLYYRLNSAMLSVPPLRERKEDIPLLIDHFVTMFSQAQGVAPKSVSPGARELLSSNPWPDNVRGLRNAINYATAVCAGDTIRIEDLPPGCNGVRRAEAVQGPIEESERSVIIRTLQKVGYNKKEAAEILKISRKTLYNKIEYYGIAASRTTAD